MTRKEASKIIKDGLEDMSLDFVDEEQYEALTMAIKALQEPSGDAVSRQVVLEQIHCCIGSGEYRYAMSERFLIDRIKTLPSVKQERTGYWEWVQYDSNPNIGNWHCSECRTIIPHMPEETDNTPIYKWCPMCGARMVEQESEGV